MREPRGHLDLLLLAALADGPAHGYRAIELLRDRSSGAFDYPEGSVYPALHRLEARGMLQSGWSSASGRRRRTYELTRKGRAALGSEARSWRHFAGAVDSVLAGIA